MKKREFIRQYTIVREAALREGYKNDPHGPACLAMSLLDVPQEAKKLWRKHRHAFQQMAWILPIGPRLQNDPEPLLPNLGESRC